MVNVRLPAVPAMAILSPSARIRRTAFSDMVEASGVKAYTSYNHMLLPTVFRGLEEDYTHLRTHVQVWDVACERQVQITGPDAFRLVQMMTPRDLSASADLRCYYVPLVDQDGMVINDPIATRLSADRWWLSIADSDVLLWAKGLAYGLKLDVTIDEPDVSPLAVQGPKADALIARVFSPEVAALKSFRAGWFPFLDRQLLVAKTGWSHQGGYEIYLDDSKLGPALWNALFAAGSDLSVGPGCPNLIERIESGLISYGGDATFRHNPYEMGLGKFCHPDRVECIGRDSLLKVMAAGPDRMIRGLRIETEKLAPCAGGWALHAELGGTEVFAGTVSAAAMSPRYGAIGLAMIEKAYMAAGTRLLLTTPDGIVPVTVSDLPMPALAETTQADLQPNEVPDPHQLRLGPVSM